MLCRRRIYSHLRFSLVLFSVFIFIVLVLIRHLLFNSLYLLWETRCDNRKVEKALQILSETGHFPQNIEPDLELYATAICSYYGKSDYTHEQCIIPVDYIEALDKLRLLIEKYPSSFVVNRAIFAVIVYSQVWPIIQKKPNVLLKLRCDKERLKIEYYSQLSIANAYGYFLETTADDAFHNGDYEKAFHYYRRQGIKSGMIYCYEYGVGTAPLPKVFIWVLKGVAWALGDFDFYNYRFFCSEYNAILEKRSANK